MRAVLILVGVVLLAAGIWVTVGGGTYRQTETVAQIGSAKLEASHEKAVPKWMGVAGVVVGGLLVLGGFSRKR